MHGLSGVDRVVQERIINSEQIDGKIVKISLDYVLCLPILPIGFFWAGKFTGTNAFLNK